MYLVTIENGGVHTVIHEPGDSEVKLASASINREVNSIDSLTGTIYPGNPGYSLITPFATKVECVNLKTGETVFDGRVIQSSPEMDSDGLVSRAITCEGYGGYLNDSIQHYVEEQHYDTLTGFIQTLLNVHNSKVEDYKKVYPGNITLQTFETSSGVTKAIDRATTWENLQKKLLDSFDGEMHVRRGSDGKLYLDYAVTLGETRATRIEIARNIQEASREVDFNSAVTRLYVYGAKLTETVQDENGQDVEQETEERLTIASVNGGKEYLDDAVGIETYGIIEGYVEFDDVTQAQNLLTKGQQYLGTLTALPVSHSITALDLSYLGLDYDDFALHDFYPCYNPLIDLDETLEIVSQTIDINEPLNSSFDLGDSAFRLSGEINKGDVSQDFEDFQSQTQTQITNINNKTVANSASIKVFTDSIQQTVTEITEEVVTETVGNVVKSSKNQYYLSTSSTTPTGGSWSDTRPSGTGYLWVRLVETLLDGTVVNGTPYCVTSDPGREVSGVLTEYYRSTSNTTQTGGSWSSDFPAYLAGTYLWVRTKVSYTNPTGTETSDPVLDSTWSQLSTIDDKIGSTADDLSSSIDGLDDKIDGNNEDISNLYDQLNGLLQQVSETITKVTQLTQTADGWDFNWQTITETVTNIAGQVQTTYSEQLKYIKFIDGEIWLGRDPDYGQDDYKVVISNERIRFLVNNVETAYISSGKLYIYDAEIINRLDIGEFAFYPRDNGNLTLRYMG